MDFNWEAVNLKHRSEPKGPLEILRFFRISFYYLTYHAAFLESRKMHVILSGVLFAKFCIIRATDNRKKGQTG